VKYLVTETALHDEQWQTNIYNFIIGCGCIEFIKVAYTGQHISPWNMSVKKK
jgi:hypothetical protein